MIQKVMQLDEMGKQLFTQEQYNLAHERYRDAFILLKYIKLSQDEQQNGFNLMIKLLNNITVCCMKLQNYQEAEKTTQAVLQLDPKNFKANFNRTRCLLQLQCYLEAKQCIEICLEQNKNDKDCLHMLSQCMDQLKQTQKQPEGQKGPGLVAQNQTEPKNFPDPLIAQTAPTNQQLIKNLYQQDIQNIAALKGEPKQNVKLQPQAQQQQQLRAQDQLNPETANNHNPTGNYFQESQVPDNPEQMDYDTLNILDSASLENYATNQKYEAQLKQITQINLLESDSYFYEKPEKIIQNLCQIQKRVNTKKIELVSLCLNQVNLQQNLWGSLCEFMQKFPNLLGVQLDLGMTNINDQSINQLFKIFMQKSRLVNLSFNTFENSLTDKSADIISKFIGMVKGIQSLMLGFGGEQITIDGLGMLFKSISQLQNLQELQLSFSGCQRIVDSQAPVIAQYIQILENVKAQFELDLSNIYFSEKAQMIIRAAVNSLEQCENKIVNLDFDSDNAPGQVVYQQELQEHAASSQQQGDQAPQSKVVPQQLKNNFTAAQSQPRTQQDDADEDYEDEDDEEDEDGDNDANQFEDEKLLDN